MSGLNAIINAAGVDPSLLENSPDHNNSAQSSSAMQAPPSTGKRSISHPKKNRVSVDMMNNQSAPNNTNTLSSSSSSILGLATASPAKASLNSLLSSSPQPQSSMMTPSKDTPSTKLEVKLLLHKPRL